MEKIKLWIHQSQLIRAIQTLPDVTDFMLTGGYQCGKGYCISQLMLNLAYRYRGTGILIGVASKTITFIRKTILLDLFKILNTYNIPYHDDKVLNILSINGVHFLLLATESPQDIYGLPLSIFICDEIDELQQRIGLMVFEAMNERTSQLLPDGRKPFRVYLTTSQGLKTIYSIYLKLLEIGADFIRIKGKTKDNLKNSPDYVSRLYLLYTREEQMAYLEGEFVNIARGSVYPDFNELLHVVDPFSIDASETIFVGQDKNIGYNKACCFIKKNKNLYMIKEFSFKSISDAPQIIRTAFPTNPIFWYPDASAAELLAGYANEIKRFDINLRVGSVNPSRLARVFVVNKMFKLNRSFVFRNNPMAILALKVRTYDDSGMPAKGKGEDAPDHIMDGWDYGEWRIVMSDPDFSDIKEVTGKVR